MTKTIFWKIVLEVYFFFDSSPIRLHGEGGVYDLYCSQPPGGDQRARSFTFPDMWGTCSKALCLCSKAVVLKPVLGTPNHSIFCMSLPHLTHQLISRVCKTWNGCGLWERHTKCVVAGGPQDRFENHCSKGAVSDSPSVHFTKGKKSRPFVMLPYKHRYSPEWEAVVCLRHYWLLAVAAADIQCQRQSK